ncbi:MAG: hypothetical protein IT416_03850 [Candidatus Pacebacteria bacterium]|nr:hypothetical protein [Candidatus Paceibacterota bacterium]
MAEAKHHPAPEHLLKQIREFVTDPAKLQRVETLTEEEARLITAHLINTVEQSEMLKNDPELEVLRIIVFRRLVDWASNQAEKIQAEIFAFISDETFVNYPDFLTDPTITAAIKEEHINNHALRMSTFREYDLEILGARINADSQVEVLITHSQALAYYGSDAPQGDNIPLPKSDFDLPPEFKIGLLKKNPDFPLRDKPRIIYMGMASPAPTGYGRYIELVIQE